jgi:hypothetical protein
MLLRNLRDANLITKRILALFRSADGCHQFVAGGGGGGVPFAPAMLQSTVSFARCSAPLRESSLTDSRESMFSRAAASSDVTRQRI